MMQHNKVFKVNCIQHVSKKKSPELFAISTRLSDMEYDPQELLPIT